MVLRFFDDFFCDFSIFTNRRDSWKYIQFTIGFNIVNFSDLHGSWRFMKIEKSQKKLSKNLRTMPTYFLYHLKCLKNVHSFIQLEVLEIKISHRFQKTPPLHALSCRFCISLPVTPARVWWSVGWFRTALLPWGCQRFLIQFKPSLMQPQCVSQAHNSTKLVTKNDPYPPHIAASLVC